MDAQHLWTHRSTGSVSGKRSTGTWGVFPSLVRRLGQRQERLNLDALGGKNGEGWVVGRGPLCTIGQSQSRRGVGESPLVARTRQGGEGWPRLFFSSRTRPWRWPRERRWRHLIMVHVLRTFWPSIIQRKF